jgi:MOSC domain-containing protein
LTMKLADDEEISAAVERGEEIETRFFSRLRHARVVNGPWADHLSAYIGEPVRLVEPQDSAVDRGRDGAATIVSVASLEALAGVLGVASVDGRRFRMNVGFDGTQPHIEDEWLGRQIRVGDAVIVPQGNVGRCAVTTQNPDTGDPDLDTLKALARYRGELETTEPLPFGVHATVVAPGRVRVGDPVEPL